MSEHQFVHFLALDRPLDDGAMAFMNKQSSRAEITKWEFTNEYHYGDFRGNAQEMLRRGYDVHLHYANFGIRKLMVRLTGGMPCDKALLKAYLVKHSVEWHADQTGCGGILEIQPDADAGTYDYLEDGELLNEIAPIRDLLVEGDLRPLYLAWLACAGADEELEPPVPAGLGKLPPALKAMALFYELDDGLLRAAAETSPSLPERVDENGRIKNWCNTQSPTALKELVPRLLSGDAATARLETLAAIRAVAGVNAWPTAKPARTLDELRIAAEVIDAEIVQRATQAKEAARRKLLATIAADPETLLKRVQSLLAEQSSSSYGKLSQELADLREALGPVEGPARSQAEAEKLKTKYPSRTALIRALKKHELLSTAKAPRKKKGE